MVFGLFDGGAKKRAAELHAAAAKGDLDGVRQALDKGADINALDEKFAETALHVAVDAFHVTGDGSHVAVVELLLSTGANPDIVSNQGFSPLIIAALIGDKALSILDVLLKGNAKLETAPRTGSNAGGTALFVAASKGANKIVRRLLSAGASATHQLPSGFTLMHTAVIGGNAETIALVADAGVSVDALNDKSESPLHITAIAGNEVAAEALLARGAGLEHRDVEDCTPLMRAVLNNHAAVVKVLLARGGNPDASAKTDNSAFSPLYVAAMRGRDDIVTSLLEAGAKIDNKVSDLASVIDMAKQAGHTTTVTLLKEAVRKRKIAKQPSVKPKKLADINVILASALKELTQKTRRRIVDPKSLEGLPLDFQLILCCIFGDSNQIRQVIADGANPNTVFALLDNGVRPLTVAVKYGNDVAAVRALLDGGADAQLPNSDSRTPFLAACAMKNEEMAMLLLPQGGAVDQRFGGMTALMLAACIGSMKLVDALLATGADILAVDDSTGLGAFGFALDAKHVRLALHILECWGKPEFGNVETLPLVVVEHGDMELIRAIESRGGAIVTKQLKGRIALVAARHKDSDVLDYVLAHGADVTQRGISLNYTPLILATLTNNVSLVKRYLERGDDACARDTDQETALSLAIEKQHTEIIRLLRQAGAEVRDYGEASQEQAMLAAASDAALGTIFDLYDKGVSLNIEDETGNSPLMLATQAGHLGVVRSLFHLGADINHRNNIGLTAADLANQSDHKDVLRTLAEFGAEGAAQLLFGVDTGGSRAIDFADSVTGRISHPLKDTLPYDESSESDAESQTTEGEGDADAAVAEVVLAPELAEKLAQLETLVELPHIADRLSAEEQAAILNRIALVRLHGAEAWPKRAVDELYELADYLASMPEQVKVPPTLFSAATDGDLKKFKKLLGAGADVNATLRNGETLLIAATAGGHDAVVRELLKPGVDVNQRREDSFTALLLASMNGQESIVKLLIEHGADIDAGHSIPSSQGAPGGQTALTVAAAGKNLSMCKLLVKLGANVNVVSEISYTPLMWALANAKDGDIAKFFLQAGSNPDPDTVSVVDFATATSPLVLAASNGLLDIVKDLIRRQVRLDKPDGDGWTALKHAASQSHTDVVNALIKAGASPDLADHEGWTPLMNAAGVGSSEIVKALLNAGADVNARSKSGVTALTQAVGKYNDAKASVGLESPGQMLGDGEAGDLVEDNSEAILDLIRLLLKRGVNPDAKRDGTALIDEAQSNGHDELVMLLKKHGASATQTSGSEPEQDGDDAKPDETLPTHEVDELSEALVEAAFSGRAEQIDKLLTVGANIDYVYANGQTALAMAIGRLADSELPRLVRRNLLQTADHLMKHGASPNVSGCDPSALGVAATVGELHLVAALLKRGADKECQILAMGTPLLAAASAKHESCALALIDAGANIEARTSTGFSIVHAAAELALPALLERSLEMRPMLVDVLDKNAFTPLMLAARSGHESSVKQLLRHNASRALKDSVGLSAKDHARKAGHTQLAELL